MGESSSEMSSNVRSVESKADVEKLIASRAELLEMLKWNTAAMVALLDHHGGTVKIEKELLESIDLSKRAVQIRYDEESMLYIIESGDIEDAVQ